MFLYFSSTSTRNDILEVPIDNSLRIEGLCSRQRRSLPFQVEIYDIFVMHFQGKFVIRKLKHFEVESRHTLTQNNFCDDLWRWKYKKWIFWDLRLNFLRRTSLQLRSFATSLSLFRSFSPCDTSAFYSSHLNICTACFHSAKSWRQMNVFGRSKVNWVDCGEICAQAIDIT